MNQNNLQNETKSKSLDEIITSTPFTQDDSFTIFDTITGSEITLGEGRENIIIFVLKGKIEINTDNGIKKTLTGGRMYCLTQYNTPYIGKVLNTAVYVILKTDSLLEYIDNSTILKIKQFKEKGSEEIESLDILKMLRFFLASIVFLTKNNLKSDILYSIKKQEMLFIVKNLYEETDLIRFFKPMINSINKFRFEVESKYTNSTTVKQLAADCFMTTKTFTNHFKEEFRETPHKWIIEKKITNLNNYIFYKGYSIDEILIEFGFSTLNELNKFCVRYNLKNVLAVTRSISKK